jgi:FAD/FMN-containing dehydrogenase
MRVSRRSIVAAGPVLALASRAGRGATPMEALRSRLRGRLILPGEPGYDTARRGASFGPGEDRRPAAIAQCADADDVARAIDFARRSGLPIAVKSGGHDVLAACVAEGGMMVDLSGMTGVEIDAAARTARVQPGLRSGAFIGAAAAHDLTPVLGCNPAVGVAGLTLGGGLGWFVGRHGAACDHLLAADLVTADGARLSASAEHNRELFWALQGGGGNFGVVTSLTFRLQPGAQVMGGAVGFHGEPAAFLRFYRELMANAPRELTVELTLSGGRPATIVAICCWSGAREAGERALQAVTAFATPVFGRLGPTPLQAFAVIQPPSPGLVWRGGSLDGLSDEAITRMSAAVERAPPGVSLGLGHYMHGAACEVSDGATAFTRRPGQFCWFVGAGWRDPAQAGGGVAAVREAVATLTPASSPRAYVNYLSRDDEGAVRDAYGAPAYRRLQALKTRYDPDNVFHGNRNVRPRAAG